MLAEILNILSTLGNSITANLNIGAATFVSMPILSQVGTVLVLILIAMAMAHTVIEQTLEFFKSEEWKKLKEQINNTKNRLITRALYALLAIIKFLYYLALGIVRSILKASVVPGPLGKFLTTLFLPFILWYDTIKKITSDFVASMKKLFNLLSGTEAQTLPEELQVYRIVMKSPDSNADDMRKHITESLQYINKNPKNAMLFVNYHDKTRVYYDEKKYYIEPKLYQTLPKETPFEDVTEIINRKLGMVSGHTTTTEEKKPLEANKDDRDILIYIQSHPDLFIRVVPKANKNLPKLDAINNKLTTNNLTITQPDDKTIIIDNAISLTLDGKLGITIRNDYLNEPDTKKLEEKKALIQKILTNTYQVCDAESLKLKQGTDENLAIINQLFQSDTSIKITKTSQTRKNTPRPVPPTPTQTSSTESN